LNRQSSFPALSSPRATLRSLSEIKENLNLSHIGFRLMGDTDEEYDTVRGLMAQVDLFFQPAHEHRGRFRTDARTGGADGRANADGYAGLDH
jgi:hypothetical protein